MSTAQTVSLKIKTLNQEPFTIIVPEHAKVLDVKNAIHEAKDFDLDRQRIIYKGRVLQNDKTLDDYKIQADDTLHVVLRNVPVSGTSPNDQPQPQQTSHAPHVHQPQVHIQAFTQAQNIDANGQPIGVPLGVPHGVVMSAVHVNHPDGEPQNLGSVLQDVFQQVGQAFGNAANQSQASPANASGPQSTVPASSSSTGASAPPPQSGSNAQQQPQNPFASILQSVSRAAQAASSSAAPSVASGGAAPAVSTGGITLTSLDDIRVRLNAQAQALNQVPSAASPVTSPSTVGVNSRSFASQHAAPPTQGAVTNSVGLLVAQLRDILRRLDPALGELAHELQEEKGADGHSLPSVRSAEEIAAFNSRIRHLAPAIRMLGLTMAQVGTRASTFTADTATGRLRSTPIGASSAPQPQASSSAPRSGAPPSQPISAPQPQPAASASAATGGVGGSGMAGTFDISQLGSLMSNIMGGGAMPAMNNAPPAASSSASPSFPSAAPSAAGPSSSSTSAGPAPQASLQNLFSSMMGGAAPASSSSAPASAVRPSASPSQQPSMQSLLSSMMGGTAAAGNNANGSGRSSSASASTASSSGSAPPQQQMASLMSSMGPMLSQMMRPQQGGGQAPNMAQMLQSIQSALPQSSSSGNADDDDDEEGTEEVGILDLLLGACLESMNMQDMTGIIRGDWSFLIRARPKVKDCIKNTILGGDDSREKRGELADGVAAGWALSLTPEFLREALQYDAADTQQQQGGAGYSNNPSGSPLKGEHRQFQNRMYRHSARHLRRIIDELLLDIDDGDEATLNDSNAKLKEEFVDLTGGGMHHMSLSFTDEMVSVRKIVAHLIRRFCSQSAPEQFAFMAPMLVGMLTNTSEKVYAMYQQKLATMPNLEGQEPWMKFLPPEDAMRWKAIIDADTADTDGDTEMKCADNTQHPPFSNVYQAIRSKRYRDLSQVVLAHQRAASTSSDVNGVGHKRTRSPTDEDEKESSETSPLSSPNGPPKKVKTASD